MAGRVSQTAQLSASPGEHRFPVRRNILLLAACLTSLSGMLQLAAAVATITLVLVTGVESTLGLGPAIFLASGAVAAFPAGPDAMDRVGRVPVIAAGFLIGAGGCGLTALGCTTGSAVLVVLGLVGVGISSGAVLLSRAAAADMVPPPRKARAISVVLFGTLFGALLGPLVFRPLFAGKELELDSLVLPWLAAGGISLVGAALALAVRPDPRTIAIALDTDEHAGESTAPLTEILRRPGVLVALVAAVASFAVMVGVMNLTGYIIVERDHAQADVFTVISVHMVGMYALVLVVGALVERIGRREAAVAGLLLMAASTLPLWWIESILWTSVALFGLGLGWSLSYVAAAAELVTRAAPSERGRLVGFTDLLAGMLGAALALLGGVALTQIGVAAVAIGATAIVVAPALVIAARRTPVPIPADGAA